MSGAWLGMAIVLIVLLGLSTLLQLLQKQFSPSAELLRKLMHVGMGCVAISFPWLFHEQWPVLVLGSLATALLLIVRSVPTFRLSVGSVLHGVKRPSIGEICFPIAVCTVFALSGRDKLLYCVPMVIMTLADTVAALIGLAYGRVRYVTSEGLKSAEGSIAFFGIAFLSVHIPLLLFTDVGRAKTLLIASIIGLLSMLLEAIAWRGLDNLLIPLGAFAFLKLYLNKSANELGLRLAATLLLLIFALSWRRRSSLDDSALMAGALFGYGALMLGGPLWLIGPVLLFSAHAILWPRSGADRDHSIFSMLSVVSVPLLWLALFVRNNDSVYGFGYAVTFGVHLAMVGVAAIDPLATRAQRARDVTIWIGAGWALALAQSIPLSLESHYRDRPLSLNTFIIPLATVLLGAIVFDRLRPMLYGPRSRRSTVHVTSLLIGLIASLLAAAVLAHVDHKLKPAVVKDKSAKPVTAVKSFMPLVRLKS